MAVKTRVNVKAWSETTPGGTEYYLDGNKVLGVGATVPLATLADFTRGDLIIGGAVQWGDLAHPAAAGRVLTTDATDTLWSTYTLTGTAGGTTALAVTSTKTLTLTAADSYNLTAAKTGTLPVGTGAAGRLAEWVTDANTLQASTLIKSGAGVLTLSAGSAYTLTVTATGATVLRAAATVLTAGRIPFASDGNTIADDANLTWNGTVLNVGAKTDAHGITETFMTGQMVMANDDVTRIFMDTYNAAADGPQIIGWHARGTQASPTATQANDALLYLRAAGYGTALTGSRSRFDMFAAETFDASSQGTYSEVWNTPTGATTPARHVRFAATGNVLIGTTTDGMTAAGSLAVAKDLAHRGANAGFYNVPPIARPTTASAAGVFAANAGTAVNDASTFDGYTLKQVIRALKDLGLLT